jgi:hypothetical protein
MQRFHFSLPQASIIASRPDRRSIGFLIVSPYFSMVADIA